MSNRVLVVLLACVVAFASLIGLILTRQRPLSLDEATVVCQRQVPNGSVEDLRVCIRAKQYPRPLPSSKAVVLVPLLLGGTAVVGIAVVARRKPTGGPCPVCGGETMAGDDSCVRCGAPLGAG